MQIFDVSRGMWFMAQIALGFLGPRKKIQRNGSKIGQMSMTILLEKLRGIISC